MGIRKINPLINEVCLQIFFSTLLGMICDQAIRTTSLQGQPMTCQSQIFISVV